MPTQLHFVFVIILQEIYFAIYYLAYNNNKKLCLTPQYTSLPHIRCSGTCRNYTNYYLTKSFVKHYGM